VGIRNGVTQVTNAPADQGKIIALLWNIGPENGGMKDVSSPASPGSTFRCDPTLAAAILAFQSFWVQSGDLRVADGVVDPGGATLRKLDALSGGGIAPTPSNPSAGMTDLNVLSFQQTMPGVAASLSIPAITPGSVMPFLFPPVPKGSMLVEGPAIGTVSEFLFKIVKNGSIFWVGAAVPEGTTDFSRVYIFFHPDTIAASDDAAYPSFSGRWPTVQRYVAPLGIQMASLKKMALIVPFMTNASGSNSSSTNLFGSSPAETLNDIVSAIQITLGLTVPQASVQTVGVSSFSSGVNHLFRFAQKLGPSGLIREQIDFDSAFMIVAHKTMPFLQGAVNWMVTQSPPPGGRTPGWLYLPASSFKKISTMSGDTHSQIGFMMFQTMMMLSAVV
jgi:hypothetical protein